MWGSVVTLTPNPLTEGDETGDVTLNPGEKAHVQVERTDAGITDAFVIEVLGNIGASPSADESPLAIFRWSPGDVGQNEAASFIVGGVYQFRLRMTAEGLTDTVTVVARYRLDGVNLS